MLDPKAPDDVAWFGSDAVAVLYRKHSVLVGPQGDVAIMQLDEACANCTIVVYTEVEGPCSIPASDIQFVGMTFEVITLVQRNKQSPGLLVCLD